jgi:hypothetical protein
LILIVIVEGLAIWKFELLLFGEGPADKPEVGACACIPQDFEQEVPFRNRSLPSSSMSGRLRGEMVPFFWTGC